MLLVVGILIICLVTAVFKKMLSKVTSAVLLVQEKNGGTVDGWLTQGGHVFLPWVSASKTAAMDHCLTQNNDGSRRKECRAAIETAVPGAMRQAAINLQL